MSAADLDRYGDLLGESVQIASNIRHTEGANWDPFTLSTEYDTLSRGPLPPQVHTYTYQVRSQTTVTTGNMPEISGVYIPDVEVSCPQFLVSYRPAPPANVFMRYDDLLHPETGEKYGEAKVTGRRNCTWALVEPQDASGV
ncbi:hypothetical protein GCM10011572_53800 [Pseudoduganella buxea]|uniref:Uncharacterized protein n=1 Tax=Pseudoduganella buxea TaxID=1949069 RepID=A0ABQ1LNN3_9BURK|nr:hypothetical protein GCM10011572_53800 [Pseudoduganella buxea]